MSLQETVLMQLRDLVLRGQFEPGQRLAEQQLAERLGAAGATRLCALGQMTAPEAGWHHDGRFSLLDLVRMVELEQSAEDAAEAYAPYRD